MIRSVLSAALVCTFVSVASAHCRVSCGVDRDQLFYAQSLLGEEALATAPTSETIVNATGAGGSRLGDAVGSAVAIPEPTTLTVLVLGSLVGLTRRSRRR